jgi:protein-disulfide isomerase
MKASPTSSTSGAPSSDVTAEASGQPGATRSVERRNTRRHEAQQKAKQKKQLQLLGGGVALAVVVAVILIFANRPSSSGLDIDYSGVAFAPPPVTLSSGTPAASPITGAQQSVSGAVLGDPEAPVTMVIYADFQCPYCRLFAAETQPKIIDDFVRSGQVKLEFREFPVLGGADLTDDTNESAQSAEAVLCAAEQDQYLEYHDKLYANQRGENQGAFSNERLKQFADELGMDTASFNTCLEGGRYETAIAQSKAEGQALGITATPMFVINGNVTSMTDQGYDLLKKQIGAAIETAS